MINVVKEDSYSRALTAIYNRLISIGKKAEINPKHNCVDVLDSDNNCIEQHYPSKDDDTIGTRGKFIKVGQGKGDYILQTVKYTKHNYTDDGKNYVKNVESGY